MNFSELLMTRQSDRGYAQKPVEHNKIIQCLEAARLAPSACNAQPWKFIVVDDPALKNNIAETTCGPIAKFNSFVHEAPVIVAVVNVKGSVLSTVGSVIKAKSFDVFDCGSAAEHFCLQAAELSLGSCMIGWFDEKKVKKLLSVPKKYSVEILITLGYPSHEKLREKKRKEVEEMSAWNSFNASER